MTTSDNAFQADLNENMDIVEVDVHPFASAAINQTSEIVSDNDEFETNADDEEDDEFTSSSDIDIYTIYMARRRGRGNPEDEDVEDINRHPEETSTTGHVYPHDHSIRLSSSHHATPSPSGHPAHSPGVGDEHTSTSRRPPAPHRHSFARSSSSRLRSSIPQPLEEIPDFFRPPIAPADGENPLIYLIAEQGLYPSSVAAKKMSLVFKSGYLKEGWKWEYVPQAQRDIYWLHWKVFFTWDLPMSFAIYDAWCRRAAIRYTGNIYLIAKKRITPVYLTEEEKKLQRRPTWKEMFRHLHTHGHDGQSFVDQRSAKIDAELTRRLEEISTQTPDTSIDEDAVYLEVVPEVKGRVYGLGSQGYHRSIYSGGASSSQGPAYGLHELEELQRDHQRLQETLLKERMERQEQMQRDKMERQEETREMQDRLARTERSGPQSDDHPGHLTTEITPSQSGHPHDHRSGHLISPHRRMSEDQRHLLDDHNEFMEQIMPPPRPPPRQEYVQRSRLICVLHKEANLPHHLGCKFQRILCHPPAAATEALTPSHRDVTGSGWGEGGSSCFRLPCG
ncbi:hypothetical protein Syun_006500 [Stephania yunnanensis]|uniref:Uncharacterized protein n=1 Tax=Stephania yunnanensis TaxID=152371 RepID=A0AAP0KYD0_9MAGN